MKSMQARQAGEENWKLFSLCYCIKNSHSHLIGMGWIEKKMQRVFPLVCMWMWLTSHSDNCWEFSFKLFFKSNFIFFSNYSSFSHSVWLECSVGMRVKKYPKIKSTLEICVMWERRKRVFGTKSASLVALFFSPLKNSIREPQKFSFEILQSHFVFQRVIIKFSSSSRLKFVIIIFIIDHSQTFSDKSYSLMRRARWCRWRRVIRLKSYTSSETTTTFSCWWCVKTRLAVGIN